MVEQMTGVKIPGCLWRSSDNFGARVLPDVKDFQEIPSWISKGKPVASLDLMSGLSDI